MHRLWIPAALTLCGLAPAQLHMPPVPQPPPHPPQAIPVTPATDHPALMNQPMMDRGGATASASGGGAKAPGAPEETEAQKAAREFREKKVAGPVLRKAVKSVRELPWQTEFADAAARSAATGKPVFWVNALGDLAGFT
jgi:hypothetical protein